MMYEAQQLIDELRNVLTTGREMKGQTVVEHKQINAIIEDLRKSLKQLVQRNGSLSLEEPLRSATVAVVHSINKLETLFEEGFPIWGKLIVDKEKLLKQVELVETYMRHAYQFAPQKEAV